MKSVGLVDLYQPTLAMFDGAGSPYTINGVHLGDSGYAALAPILMNALFGTGESTKADPLLTKAILGFNLLAQGSWEAKV